MNRETSEWLVTVFFESESSIVYGLFDSKEKAVAWAESNYDGWDSYVVQQLRRVI
jgi:hypothetical protein